MGITGWIIGALSIGTPLWKLPPRAGLSQALAIAAVIRFLGLVMSWVIAFRVWPGDNAPRRFE